MDCFVCRYDHQERLTAIEAMEHPYFYPIVKDQQAAAAAAAAAGQGRSGAVGSGVVPMGNPGVAGVSAQGQAGNSPTPAGMQGQVCIAMKYRRVLNRLERDQSIFHHNRRPAFLMPFYHTVYHNTLLQIVKS